MYFIFWIKNISFTIINRENLILNQDSEFVYRFSVFYTGMQTKNLH